MPHKLRGLLQQCATFKLPLCCCRPHHKSAVLAYLEPKYMKLGTVFNRYYLSPHNELNNEIKLSVQFESLILHILTYFLDKFINCHISFICAG